MGVVSSEAIQAASPASSVRVTEDGAGFVPHSMAVFCIILTIALLMTFGNWVLQSRRLEQTGEKGEQRFVFFRVRNRPGTYVALSTAARSKRHVRALPLSSLEALPASEWEAELKSARFRNVFRPAEIEIIPQQDAFAKAYSLRAA